ncbi:hypothetical protein KAR91_59625 [Candidatus Pacearchaeota archaeon]|nr:hypothetical protein [Candidatus Pacearchaeota archaeon]
MGLSGIGESMLSVDDKLLRIRDRIDVLLNFLEDKELPELYAKEIYDSEVALTELSHKLYNELPNKSKDG